MDAAHESSVCSAVFNCIIVDFGQLPVDADSRHDLLLTIEQRYGRRSTIITSRFPAVGKPAIAQSKPSHHMAADIECTEIARSLKTWPRRLRSLRPKGPTAKSRFSHSAREKSCPACRQWMVSART